MLSLFLVLFCTLAFVGVARSESRAKDKESGTITIEKGKTYKLKCGKGCTYKSTKPQIASVSKKAVIKAKKIGKCIVELVENDIINLKGKFKDCPNVQYIICKCMRNYEVNSAVSIIVNQNEYLSKYTVKDEKTIELTCEHFF